MVVSFVHTWAVFEGVNKAGDVVWGDGNDEGVGDDCQHTDTFENPMPDTWQPNQRRINIFHYFLKCKRRQLGKFVFSRMVYKPESIQVIYNT